LKIKEENFPCQARVKQLKACWIKKIKTLKELLEECNEIISKMETLYKKLTEIYLARNTGEVQDPHLIINFTFLTREKFEEHMKILKILLAEKFNGIKEYNEYEIDNWLDSYSNKNEYVEN